MRPRIVPTPKDASSGGESWLVDGTYIGKARNVGHDTAKESREMEDIRARLKHMDELHVDVQVLYPTIFLRPFTRRPEVELAVSRSYNRWLIDIWKKAPERLRWVAVLPLLSMEKAIAEARFAKENGACGIFMRGLEGDKHISDVHFFAIYEEAGKLDLPICVHSATGSFAVHDFFLNECGFNKFKLAVVGSFHTLVFNKIPEKFPKTKWAFIEVSSQWVPYAIHARRSARRRRQSARRRRAPAAPSPRWEACGADHGRGEVPCGIRNYELLQNDQRYASRLHRLADTARCGIAHAAAYGCGGAGGV